MHFSTRFKVSFFGFGDYDLLCFALLCSALLASFRSPVEFSGGGWQPWRHAASPLFRVGPSVSFPRTTVRTKHARFCCLASILGDFSAFFLIRQELFSWHFWNHGSFAEKHSGFGLGVRRGD